MQILASNIKHWVIHHFKLPINISTLFKHMKKKCINPYHLKETKSIKIHLRIDRDNLEARFKRKRSSVRSLGLGKSKEEEWGPRLGLFGQEEGSSGLAYLRLTNGKGALAVLCSWFARDRRTERGQVKRSARDGREWSSRPNEMRGCSGEGSRTNKGPSRARFGY